MIDKFDLVIVGAGIVGLTAALAVAKEGHQIAIVAPKLAEEALPEHAQRVSAINLASVNAYKNLNVWQGLLNSQRLSPYNQMQVWDKNSIGKIGFSAAEQNLSELGYIIENQLVENELIKALAELDNCRFYQTEVEQLDQDIEQALLKLATGELLQTKLLIGADGANSKLRTWLDIPLTFSDYGQTAIVATVQTELPHELTARQVFTPDGPLAFLPLVDSNLCSIVWSQTHQQADQLLALSDSEFNNKLTAAIDGNLGQCQIVNSRMSFPLTMRYAQSFIKDTCVLIGDAAHTIHPLAGQGANLGIIDALAIAEAANQQLSENGQINLVKLKQVMRWRQADAVERIAAMYVFKTGFSNDLLPLKIARAAALNLVDLIGPVKSKFIQAALGNTGRLPELAKTSLT
ncbi:FAD-dependent monooxygenase [Catenovulum maritimum]|uniref:FAD-binding domain-containing protein n=1 Tax=Catenovulum maritimum TaxID=1513271 RepID=A0A0J8GT43_9ALTE|nr:FAD-dependent monooxygenase [Catenovulum maritimum]KMT63873.1 hypothetical protein XM47_17535 [Catenovulum maritimum]